RVHAPAAAHFAKLETSRCIGIRVFGSQSVQCVNDVLLGNTQSRSKVDGQHRLIDHHEDGLDTPTQLLAHSVAPSAEPAPSPSPAGASSNSALTSTCWSLPVHRIVSSPSER